MSSMTRAAARAASEALARTPQQLPALARAGVVDAGGRGLCLLLDALVEALTPAAPTDPASTDPASTASASASPAVREPTSANSAPTSASVSRAVREPTSALASATSAPTTSAVREPTSAPTSVASPSLSSPVLSSAATSASSAPTSASSAPSATAPSASASVSAPSASAYVSAPSAIPASSSAITGLPTVTEPGNELDRGDAGLGHKAEKSRTNPEGEYGYEVQYLLDAAPAAVDTLRGVLDGLGDSLVVVGTGGDGLQTWNVHVHVAAGGIGPAMEAGVEAGRPYRISVTPLDDNGHGPGEADRPVRKRGAVVVAAGDGLTSLFEAEGATVVDRNPSTGEMLTAIAATGARCVVLLPNDANTHAVAVSAAREAEKTGVRVSVVPTRSPVQALAALAVRDLTRPFADDVIAMAEAAGACRYGEVCTAQRDSLTVAGPCRAGDLLGLVDGEVHVIGDDLAAVSLQLLDRMLGGGGELATLVLGAGAPDGLEDKLRGYVARAWPFVELHSYAGGQPRYHLLVGVE
ncbi:DAK2 domain-containing protein [Actinoplanes sp. NPDC049596]|uniref:DAK2 domain-containing protein n=1 Tax=Actinoplanes sp. NPDC049596 TaxID=3154625 RepID=UPI00342DDCEF